MFIDQFTEWEFIHNPKISPKKDKIIFELTKPDLEENSYQSKLYAYDINQQKFESLTNINSINYFFADDMNQLFIADLEKTNDKESVSSKTQKNKSKYWVFDLDTRESKFSFELNLNVNEIFQLDNSNFLIEGSKIMEPTANSPEQEWLEIEELPFWLNGNNYTINQINQIFILDSKIMKLMREEQTEKQRLDLLNSINNEKSKIEHAETNESKKYYRLISDEDENISFFEMSPDKKNLLIVSSQKSKLLPLKENVFIYHLDSQKKEALSLSEFNVFSIKFINEQFAYMIATDNKSHGINSDPYIYLINLKDLSIKKINDDDIAFGNSIGTDAKYGSGEQIVIFNDELYFICTVENRSLLKKVNLTGKMTTVIDFDGSLLSFQILDGDIYFVGMENLGLPELFKYQSGNIEQLSHYSNSLNKTPLSEIETFQFESNNDILDGFVLKPSNYQPGQKYPGLLEIHGGPKTVFGKILHHEMQYLADQGYFVFYTNPHGSDAYGSDFSDIRGQYGSIDYQDLMTFTDLVLEKYPDIDEQKIGCLGGSYGGFMVNWIIGHTDRFAAANSQRSISNWLSFYGVSDIGFYFAEDQTDGDPWKSPEKLWDQSPLKYANKVKTPTLFIHSDHDFRCPLEQGIQMYAGLMKNNINTKLVVFKNETHELSRSGKPKARIKRLAEITKWFDHYLK